MPFLYENNLGIFAVAGSSGGGTNIITQSITLGDTTHAPSGDAVFNAIVNANQKLTTEPITQIADFTAEANKIYFVDSTSNPIMITLPIESNDIDGAEIIVKDYVGSSLTKNISIRSQSGGQIVSIANNFSLVNLIYSAGQYGWMVKSIFQNEDFIRSNFIFDLNLVSDEGSIPLNYAKFKSSNTLVGKLIKFPNFKSLNEFNNFVFTIEADPLDTTQDLILSVFDTQQTTRIKVGGDLKLNFILQAGIKIECNYDSVQDVINII